MNNLKIKLKNKLSYLKENHSLAGIKGGTEIEALNFDEIYHMRMISRNILPMTIKIGGPEARNDISYMLKTGVDKILAPMIESPYSLKNFVQTMADMDKNNKTKLAINIETIFAFYNLNEIFGTEYFEKINQVTVGRSDLSSSMQKEVDDNEVTRVTKEIIDLARLKNKTTSTGGKIGLNNASLVKTKIGSDFINTRHMTVNLNSKNISEDIKESLLWENSFYKYLITQFPERKIFYNSRIKSIESRIESDKKNTKEMPSYMYL